MAAIRGGHEPIQLWIAPEGGHGDLADLGFDAVVADFIRRSVRSDG